MTEIGDSFLTDPLAGPPPFDSPPLFSVLLTSSRNESKQCHNMAAAATAKSRENSGCFRSPRSCRKEQRARPAPSPVTRKEPGRNPLNWFTPTHEPEEPVASEKDSSSLIRAGEVFRMASSDLKTVQ